jgi:magnesium-transporting ATPase (P-type)
VNHFERGESIHGYLDASNIALTNFWVISGHGNGLVIPTENHSIQFINEITKRMTRFNSNPIGRALNQIALGVFVMTMMCEIIYLIVWVCYLRTIHTYTFTQVLSNLLHMFLTGIPFGLPMSLNFGLLFLVRYLGKLHILVKNMFSLATMSSIDVVLTDKTGTLTHNVYEVSDLFFGNGELDVEMNLQSANISEGLKKLLDLCDFCSFETEIDRIDQTLCRFAQRNRPFDSLRDYYDIIDEIAFTSTNMYQARLIQVKEEKENVLYKESNALGIKSPSVLMIRGMPEFILPKCRYMLRADSGEKMKMNEMNMKTIESKIEEWSAMGHRIVCFAKKAISEEAMEKRSEENYDFPKWFNGECNRLVFAGMIGFMDHPKPW